MTIKIGDQVPTLALPTLAEGEVRTVSLADFRGRWLVVLFYPGDFTFICPTELREAARLHGAFQAAGAEVVAVSTDSVWVHKAWQDASASIADVAFPMMSDRAGRLSRAFGVYLEEDGEALRGSFVVDPDGKVVTAEVHDNSVGRSIEELLRRVRAARFVRENPADVCPVSWQPGRATLRPGLALVGAI
jgi:peroxiredoxin